MILDIGITKTINGVFMSKKIMNFLLTTSIIPNLILALVLFGLQLIGIYMGYPSLVYIPVAVTVFYLVLMIMH